MKVEKREIEIQRSDDFQEQAMGLAKGSESFIFNVLRKDLYSDPVGSLLREYSVNAQDEHRKFNIDKPILIQAPTSFNPELHIRDYANGLTEAQVMEFFGQYGASDKRDSNDVVGFYGLGAKSAFSYTDSYVVKSFKDGKVYTFNIYIDETEIGRVAKLSEEATEESNGIEIIVPVRVKDIADFQRKVVSTVQYFKVRPTLEGFSTPPVFPEPEVKIEGDGWKFLSGEGDAICIMGEIAYPINQYAIDDLVGWEKSLLESNIQLYLNIGDVQVTASREALQMSEKTIKAIRAKLVEIKDSVVEQTLKAFADAKNLFEAKSLYYSLMRRGQGLGRIVEQAGVDLVWNGVTIEDNTIELSDLHSITHYTKVRKRGGYYSAGYKVKENSGVHKFRVGEESNVYFDDVTDKRTLYLRRANTLILNGDLEEATFIHTTDVKKLEEELGTPVTAFESLQAVTPAPIQSRAGNGSTADKSKHLAKVFQLNVDKLLNGSYSIASEVWEVKTMRKGGIFIPIHRFKPTMGRIDDLDELRSALVSLRKLGVKIPTSFYGLKNTDSTDGMISFMDWYKRKADSLTEYKEMIALGKSYTDADAFDVRQLDETKVLNPDTQEYIKTFKEAYKAYYDGRHEREADRVFSLAGIQIEASINLTEMAEKVVQQYPLLPIIDDLSDDRVLDYMAMVDGKIMLDKSNQDSVALDG